MCGIAGISSTKSIDEKLAPILLTSLCHRGPDDQGSFFSSDRKVLLTHTRLSILDLSPAGHQPMTNEACPERSRRNQPLWITYNGEIYNFQELRSELLAKGHRFSSQTDTEVILHLYEEEGEALVQRLIGMFALAIYDPRNRRLLLARDRLGIKPLYYAEHGGNFLFASEIKTILATGLIPQEIDWQAISDYFTFLFIPHPQTAFQKIRQVPPAHTLVYDLKEYRHRLHRYWTPWPNASPSQKSYGELRDQVRELVTDAVRSELVSDVPLGLFFSGGIDSTLLAALMTRFSKEPVKTFTVIFQGSESDPRQDLMYARSASRAIGTDHHELSVELETPEQFFGMIRHVDQPFGNPTLYLQYLIAKATRKEVTVALSGVGGDELFGGYPKYRLLPWAPFLQLFPAALGQRAYQLLGSVREDTWQPILRRTKRLLRGVGHPLPQQYLEWSYALTEPEKRELLPERLGGKALQPAVRIIEKAMSTVPLGTDRYGRVLFAELETFLADNLLEYTDRATMAVALEARVPYLDHRLVELSAKIPFGAKIHQGQSKHILIDAFRDLIPKNIASAPKRGFSPPMGRWFENILDRYFEEALNKQRTEQAGIFSWEAIQKLRALHRAGYRDASAELTAILMFDVWYQPYR